MNMKSKNFKSMRNRATLRGLSLGVVFLSLLTSFDGAQADSGKKQSKHSVTHQVHIRNMKFVPETVEVHVGDQVVWTNEDIVPHTVTAKNPSGGKPDFNSGAIESGKTFKKRMSRAGAIDYVCSFHPTMKAKIIVQGR
jgi:plastocyanin